MDNCNISPNTIYKLTEVLKYISGVEIYRLYSQYISSLYISTRRYCTRRYCVKFTQYLLVNSIYVKKKQI